MRAKENSQSCSVMLAGLLWAFFFPSSENVPDNGQHFPLLVGCQDGGVGTKFHGLLDKCAMSLVTEENDITARASNVEPGIHPGTIGVYHLVIHKDDGAVHPFRFFCKFFEIDGNQGVIVVFLAELANMVADVVICDQEENSSLSFERSQCLEVFHVSTRS